MLLAWMQRSVLTLHGGLMPNVDESILPQFLTTTTFRPVIHLYYLNTDDTDAYVGFFGSLQATMYPSR